MGGPMLAAHTVASALCRVAHVVLDMNRHTPLAEARALARASRHLLDHSRREIAEVESVIESSRAVIADSLRLLEKATQSDAMTRRR